MRRVLPTLMMLLALGRAQAADGFRVEDIRVEGLQRVPVGTVLNYLPIRVGEDVDSEQVADAIRSLYRTGFFQDVALDRQGGVLVVQVVERPAIGNIDVRGNDAIPTEELMKALKSVGLSDGQVFNRSLLTDMERELRRLYQSRGQYDTKVESTVSPLPRNRVGIRIDIKESEPATIHDIHFVGNEKFSDDDLLDVFELGPRAWYQFFSDKDEYSREKLGADLERLRSFYQDQGYINFAINSTQVAVTPDRTGIFITIGVSEGDQYRIGEFKLAGDLVVDESELRGLVQTTPGELYSREQLTESVRRIRDRLGDEGYAFANVNAVPEVDEEKHTVALTYYVDPGKRVFVRRINIRGNERTADPVIRRELRQQEGAWLATGSLQRSRQRLQRLGFFEDVNIETPPVPGEADQVDVNVTVKERLSGSLQAGLGYGQSQGVVVSAAVMQDNVLGSGDRLSVEINSSSVDRVYSVAYLDRYFTQSGISQLLNLSQRQTNASEAGLADYDTKNSTIGVTYGFPINEDDTVFVGVAAERMELKLGTGATTRLHDFVNTHGDAYNELKLNLTWQRDNRDNAVFATRGAKQSVALELAAPGSDLEYYRLSYSHKRFFSLTKSLTLSLSGGLGYGDGYGSTESLPFFESFYAGGISTVRGFRSNTLGPHDPENDRPIGGNSRILGSVEVMFPAPGLEMDSLRLSTFVDAGNIFNAGEGLAVDEVRVSSGLGLTWLSPLGALTMSLARPLNSQDSDRTEFFQFSLGSFF